MPGEMNPTARDILGKYTTNLDTRALPEHNARALAFEMAEIAHRDNAGDKPWLAIGALSHAVRALASSRPGSEHDESYEPPWNWLADKVRQREGFYRGECANASKFGLHAQAAIMEARADALAEVLGMMGESLLGDKDEMDTVSGVLGRLSYRGTAEGADEGIPPSGDRLPGLPGS